MTRTRILEALEGESHATEEPATTLRDNPEPLREYLVVLEADNIVDTHKMPDDTEFVLASEPPVPEM